MLASWSKPQVARLVFVFVVFASKPNPTKKLEHWGQQLGCLDWAFAFVGFHTTAGS